MGMGGVAQVVYTFAKGITLPLLSVKTDLCTLALVAERVTDKGALVQRDLSKDCTSSRLAVRFIGTHVNGGIKRTRHEELLIAPVMVHTGRRLA